MSFETDAMDFVLGLLTDGIYTTTTQQNFYTGHDKIKGKLPFVQTFLPIRESTLLTFGEKPATVTFNLELIDVRGKSNDLRTAAENLYLTFRRDPTFGDTVRDATIVVSQVRVVGADEFSVLTMVISVTHLDGFMGDPVDIIDFAGRASDIIVGTVNDTVEDSTVVPGGIGFTHIGAGAFPFWTMTNTLNGGGFEDVFGSPLDLTDTPVMRTLTYMQPSASNLILAVSTVFLSGNNLTASVTYTQPGGTRVGWQEHVIDLDTAPDFSSGSFNRAGVRAIRIQYTAFNTALPDVIVKRIFFYPRDTGSRPSGISTGF